MIADGSGDLGAEGLVESTAVRQSGERVGHREFTGLLVHPRRFDRDCCVACQRLEDVHRRLGDVDPLGITAFHDADDYAADQHGHRDRDFGVTFGIALEADGPPVTGGSPDHSDAEIAMLGSR